MSPSAETSVSVITKGIADALVRPTTGFLVRPGGQVLRQLIQPVVVEAGLGFHEAPVRSDRTYTGSDGVAYFVPEAFVAKRRNNIPDVFVDHVFGPQTDKYVLRVGFDLRRDETIPPSSQPIALTEYQTKLVSPRTGKTIDLIPALAAGADPDKGVIARLRAEAEVERAVILDVLQNDAAAWFELSAQTMYRLLPPGSAPGNAPAASPEAAPPDASPGVAERGGFAGILNNDIGSVILRDTSHWRDTVVIQPAVLWAMANQRFDGINAAMIGNHLLSGGKINGSNNSENQLTERTILVYQTNQGRVGKLMITSYGYNLQVRWATFNQDGTVYRFGDDLQIKGTWLHDMDEGQATSDNGAADFWWEQVDETVRFIVPMNGASFAVYDEASIPPPPPPVTTARIILASSGTGGPSAFFPKRDRSNRPIYAESDPHFEADPDAHWTNAPLDGGMFMESPIPDQFFILPDEYRLAFDAERGLPSMKILLIRGEPGPAGQPSYKVRVGFSVAPWFDALRLERLREFLRGPQYGVPYAELVVGGYERALFTPTQMYSQIGGAAVGSGSGDSELEADAARGFEIVLDCTWEFYTLLTTVLVDSGLEGKVVFTLKSDGDTRITRETRVRLKLDSPAAPPLELKNDESALPGDHAVLIESPADARVTIQEVRATLLAMDAETPFPVSAIKATAEPRSLVLDPAGERLKKVAITPVTPTELALGAGVAVAFVGVSVVLDAQQVLNRHQELAASANVSSTIKIGAYLLAHPELLPPSHTTVYQIDVQLERGSGEPVLVSLTRDAPAQQTEIAYSFKDLLDGVKPELPRFRLRRRNRSSAGTGDWSEWETIVGRDLSVAPVGL